MLSQILVSSFREKDKEVIFTSYSHNAFFPSLMVLLVYGYKLNLNKIIPTDDISYYVDKLIPICNEIDSIRDKSSMQDEYIINDVLIFCPSIYTFFYSFDSKEWRDLIKAFNLSKIEKIFIKNTIVKIRTYSSNKFKFPDDFDIKRDIEKSQILSVGRIKELNYFTTILSLFSVSQFIPSVRIPHSVLLHHDLLIIIARQIKKTKVNTFKLNKSIRKYSQVIINDLDKELISLCVHNRKKIIAVCDFPIEWVSFDIIPLMFTHEISRVSATPGDLAVKQLICSETIRVPYKILCDVLIIRSFRNDDRIKFHLEHGIYEYERLGNLNNIKWKIVDVYSKEELINALNLFKGVMSIFDWHGGHEGMHDSGWLEIGGNKINVWDLPSSCRIPPIIILSACSTHPIDGSHASVANGFFSRSTLSVLGTAAPINSIHASMFIIRILHRVSEFLPILLKEKPITWREVISGFFKMSYVTDVLRDLEKEKFISEDQYQDLHFKANTLINSSITNWHKKFISEVAKAMQKDKIEIKNIFKAKYQFTQSMLYTQLGRSENIIIVSD